MAQGYKGQCQAIYLDGGLQLEQDGLGDKDLASFGTQVSNLGFEQLDLLSWAAATHLEQAVDYGIEVDLVLVSHTREIPLARDCPRVPERWAALAREKRITRCKPMRRRWRLEGDVRSRLVEC